MLGLIYALGFIIFALFILMFNDLVLSSLVI